MQAALLVVGRPADAVPFAQLKVLLFRKLQAIALLGRRQLLGIEAYPAPTVRQFDLPVGVDLEDVVASRLDPDVLRAAAADLERLALTVGRGIAQLLARGVDPLKDSEMDRLALDAPFRDQADLGCAG